MPSEHIEELYFDWLYSQFANNLLTRPKLTYWTLARHLHSTPFIWLVPNDDNRVDDGIELRRVFGREKQLRVDDIWLEQECSCLELILGVANRLSFQTRSTTKDCFWLLLSHLDLAVYNDSYRDSYPREEVADRLEALIFRTYDRNGKGGLFPLVDSDKDQRDVEIWYQMHNWIIDHYL